jgi:hypothetical protein
MRIAKSLAIPAALVVAAVCATPSVAATQTASIAPSALQAAPGPTAQGIIMSDGRICNPRWGC